MYSTRVSTSFNTDADEGNFNVIKMLSVSVSEENLEKSALTGNYY